MSGQLDNKGLPTCLLRQVTSQVGDEASSARINANNAWYVNTSNGSRYNTYTVNRSRVAGIVLSLVDAELAKNKAVRAEHFVDDYSIIAHSTQEAEAAINSTLPIFDSLGLKLHPQKISVQPAANGILSCGRVVKRDRIYVSNRTVRACKAAIREAPRNETGAKELCRSINSYFGLMCHCNAWNIQKTIAAKVNEDFGAWLYFKYEPNH